MTTATTPSKPSKAFYAILNEVSGSLTQIDNEVLFFAPETGAITAVTSYAGLTVLGEIGLAETQKIMDKLHGGYAAIACSR